jgi:hypothetical protein
MKVNSRTELERRLKQRYPFLPQTKREKFSDEVCSDSPRILGEKELAEYLKVKPESIPVILDPSHWPKSNTKWLEDNMAKRHPAEFDPPHRPRLHRPRKK